MNELELAIAEQKATLQDLLAWEKRDLVTTYNRKAWLRFIAVHYKTLKLVGIEEVVPDEIIAELILERLV